jgi:glutaredoxin-like protein
MSERLLNDQIVEQVKQVFQRLDQPVQLLYFGKQDDCETCEITMKLLQEVVEISDKLKLNVYDLDKDLQVAEKFHVDKAPGLVLVGKDGEELMDYGIRFAGIPSGHEFSTLIHDLVLVSGRDSQLSPATRQYLAELKEPVLLQVFVTPTCPYCPQAVVLAHQMALESPMIQAEMVEANEFIELSNRYNVSGVPQTTINHGAGTLVGAAPEENLVAEINRALLRH